MTWLFLVIDCSFPLWRVFSDITVQDKLLQFAVGGTAWMGQAFPLAQEKQAGPCCLSSQPGRAGVSWGWSPVPLPRATLAAGRAAAHCPANCREQTGGGSKARPGPGTAVWAPTTPTTHGMRVVKIERIACMKGGLRGKINAHGVKESCFNWEGKGREWNVKTTLTFLSLQGCQSPARSSGEKLCLWKGS